MSLIRYDITSLIKKLGTQEIGALDSDANTWYRQHHTPLLFVYKDGDKRQRFPASALAVSTAGCTLVNCFTCQLPDDARNRMCGCIPISSVKEEGRG